MAQQTTVTLIDDLDGGKAEETITFGLDGTVFEIDLSKKNAASLRKALAPFKDAARKAPSASAAKSARGRRPAATRSRQDLTAVREWAVANGFDIAARGRLSAKVVEAYEAAQ